MRKSIGLLNKTARHSFAIGMLLIANTGAQAASFDCAKAQSKVEKMICADAELSKLDGDLGHAWKLHLRDNKFQDQFRNTQKHWIAKRNECADAQCLKQTYQARLQQMASGKEYFLRKGQGEPLCESLVEAMNEELYRPAHGRVCAFDILQRLPEVQLPPWKKLDLQKDKELYKKFVLADHAWEELWPAAFSDPPPKAGQPIDPKSKHSAFPMPSDEYLNKVWESAFQFKEFAFYQWDNPIPLPEQGDSLLVRIAGLDDGNCPSIHTKLFTHDLKSPKVMTEYSTFSMLPFFFESHWYWFHNYEAPSPVTSSVSISQLTSIMKPYYRLDVCGVTSGQKSFKWE
ncbi:DUF1311 domain-containing protein [Curvibacter sp. CHRR-16]|uniref:lysozyme inhibitor LprI family protein n=1 Tax=Curvibacter sp. CHRR-16 TaxID=2835872 RepID=UPI001BD9281F|nr:lysozyme inhibitor LprI family protein [Curvibacter sp. CHRR-16]MBT0568880.1 DUF1311 domain-containing protein [Curvibacter sp. CHRR-16]